jgi:HEAT repeat-containing protein 5
MGGVWLERNMSEMLAHMFGLVCNPRVSVFHVDAVYARKCVIFMLRSLIGGQLSERAQIAAAKEICVVIVKQMNSIGMLAGAIAFFVSPYVIQLTKLRKLSR